MAPAHPSAARALDVSMMLKEAGLTALVMLGLCAGLVGFHILDVTGGLVIVTRFGDVIVAVVVAFLGRLGLILLREGRVRLVFLVALPLGLVLIGLSAAETAGRGVAHALLFDSVVLNWVLALFALALAARAAWLLARKRETGPTDRDAAMDRIGARVQQGARFLGPALLVFAAALPLLPFADRRLVEVAILVVTYIMLGWGLNIVVGLAGLLDLGYVAFYAVGAYSYALLDVYFGLGFWICLPFAGIMAAFAGILLGFPVLRLRGDYLAIVTLGFGEMIRIILTNWYDFTRGPNGISNIPRPSFFGLPFTPSPPEGGQAFHTFFGLEYASLQRVVFLYYLILALAMVTNLFTLRIRKLPVGRAWEALREDEVACRSLGINPTSTKLTAFAVGAMFAGFAGSFFATRQGFISPDSFTFIESAVILAIVVLGGFGSQLGVVLAAILLIGLPEFFRELQHYRMLAFGAAMVAIMVWRPKGLLAHREPTLRLNVAPGVREAPR